MKIRLISLSVILFAGLFFMDCGKEKPQPLTDSQKMRAEVMEVHDAVMPKTGDLNRYISALESIPADRQNDLTQRILTRLKAADKKMWEWMQEFEDPPENWDEERKVAYYRDEKIKIQEVADEMLASLEEAKKVVKTPHQ